MSLRKFEIRINGMKHTVHEIPNSGSETWKPASQSVEHYILAKNFDEFVSFLKLKAITPLDLEPPVRDVDPKYVYGSAAAIDEAQWDSAIAKAAANAGGRRRKAKTARRHRSTRRLQTRRHRRRRPF